MKSFSWRLSVVLLASGLLLAGWLLLCQDSLASNAPLTFRYVASNGDCSLNTPCYASLQAAVDAANNGDVLHVAAGTYSGVSARNGTTQLVYLDKSLTIRGGYHPTSWTVGNPPTPSFLDAQGLGRVFFIIGNVSPVVEGFHLVNGSGESGGAVYVETAAVTLSYNEIYDNYAEGFGGAVYLQSSAATISSNHIYSNTTGANGRGGGLALVNSPTRVEDNIIENNSSHVGGGVLLSNSLGQTGALLEGNTIRNNEAFDLLQGGYTFDGAGGGVDLSSSLVDTLQDNLISDNTAKWGGGVHAYGANAILTGNTIQKNHAPTHGGGLYFQGGQVTLENNDILTNTADSWGGGLTLLGSTATVRGNLFRANHSNWRGGGMYDSSSAQFDGNVFLENSATEQGGGVFINRSSGASYLNSVVVGNQAAEGGGLYLWAPNISLLHSTIAGNTSGDGRAVVIDKYPGLVDPSATTLYTATVVFTNTILAGHSVGFFATSENSLAVDGILWWNTPAHFQTSGATLAVKNELTGDPMFQEDGFHLRTYSAARGKGKSGPDHDVDGQLRDWGDQKDLGADEIVPIVAIDPDIGATLIYTNPQEEITITVQVPPGAVSEPVGLMISPFPPLPPDVLDSPFGKFIPFSPPFQLLPIPLDLTAPITDANDPPVEEWPDIPEISDAIIFEHYPAHIIAEVGVNKLKSYYQSMQRLELALLSVLSNPFPPALPDTGSILRDFENHTLDVPIFNTGILTPTSQTSARQPVRLQASSSGYEIGYFMFLLEGPKFYLPVIMR